ncbi:MAG: CopG family transcriptional regulator [Polyangiaceae bacterium]|nr:CopG family transcriptional regulator [Polyangiaceae bacterium]
MVRTQIYLPKEELDALHLVAKRSGQSVAQLVRAAVRQVWMSGKPPTSESKKGGLVALWSERVDVSSMDHDSIYDSKNEP